ncbi:hypothetical protein SESBI_49608 [Sesbania bispinosa]|nr:hypothetical protein SESBI_49608 [Sesbania bispinosa]
MSKFARTIVEGDVYKITNFSLMRTLGIKMVDVGSKSYVSGVSTVCNFEVTVASVWPFSSGQTSSFVEDKSLSSKSEADHALDAPSVRRKRGKTKGIKIESK